MKNVFKNLYVVSKYFSVFGIAGLFLIFKISRKKNKIIRFSSNRINCPVFLRSNSTDTDLFWDIFIKKSYLINPKLKPLTIIDLGANIGLATIFFKNLFPDSRIISVEPEKSNFEMLLKNTKDFKNTFCINNAIWNRSTNLIIEDNGYGNWGFMVKESAVSTPESFESISIDKIITDFGIETIDILKIDIEGSEKELFEKDFEKWLPITKMIIIELHDNMRPSASRSFFKAITNYNFSLSIRGENIICTFQ